MGSEEGDSGQWKEGEGEGVGGEEEKEEEEVYSLLFRKVDTSGCGLVLVTAIVDYLQHIQLGDPTGSVAMGTAKEEVYDSQEEVCICTIHNIHVHDILATYMYIYTCIYTVHVHDILATYMYIV